MWIFCTIVEFKLGIGDGMRKEHLKFFAKYVNEGAWKIIQTIGLSHVIKSSLQDFFLYTTIITPCDARSYKMYLSLAKFDLILVCSLNTNGLVGK